MNKIFNTQEFGDAIKRRRSELGLTLRELEGITGISHATLCRIEHVQGTPDIDSITPLCKWLDMPVSSFFESEGETPMAYFPDKPTPDFVRERLLADESFDSRSANALADLFAGAYRHFVEA